MGPFLELLPSLETSEFLGSLKQLIARRGGPAAIYSKNGRTFGGVAEYLQQARTDDCPTRTYKVKVQPQQSAIMGRAIPAPHRSREDEFVQDLRKREPNVKNPIEITLDIEVALNRRPCSYVEESIRQPFLTPNSFLFVRNNNLYQSSHRIILRIGSYGIGQNSWPSAKKPYDLAGDSIT